MSSWTDTFDELAVVVAGSDGVLAVMDWEDFKRKFAIQYRKARREDLNPELAPIVGHATYGKEPGSPLVFPLNVDAEEVDGKVKVTVTTEDRDEMEVPYLFNGESLDFEFNLKGKR